MVTGFFTVLNTVQYPDTLPVKLVILALGLIICSLGLSIYQQADCGMAPYDALPVILGKWCKGLPFFWRRMIFDVTAAVVCYLAGGLIGIGTLSAAFGLGPCIHFFNTHLYRKQKS